MTMINVNYALYKLYDFTKGGTNIVDQKIGSYTVKAKSCKWTMVALSYLFDTIRVNACALFALNKGFDPKKVNSFNFGYQLAEKLVMPAIERQSRNGLSSYVAQKIEMVFPKAVLQPLDKQADKAGRCKMCLQSISGINCKFKKNKIRRTKNFYTKCKECCCKKHATLVCKKFY